MSLPPTNELPQRRPVWLVVAALLGIGVLVIVAIAVAGSLDDDEGDATDGGAVGTGVPSETTASAEPSEALDPRAGCEQLTREELDALAARLAQDRRDAELVNGYVQALGEDAAGDVGPGIEFVYAVRVQDGQEGADVVLAGEQAAPGDGRTVVTESAASWFEAGGEGGSAEAGAAVDSSEAAKQALACLE